MNWNKWVMEIGEIYDSVGEEEREKIMAVTEVLEQEVLQDKEKIAHEVLEICKKFKDGEKKWE